jgi:hypothetical protein
MLGYKINTHKLVILISCICCNFIGISFFFFVIIICDLLTSLFLSK